MAAVRFNLGLRGGAAMCAGARGEGSRRGGAGRLTRGGRPCGGFSLLETTIAVVILGIGLIMVAAIFPVALSQHRGSTYHARATELASKAEAMLRSRVDSRLLSSDPTRRRAGLDSPWYLMPFANLAIGGDWDGIVEAPNYANQINSLGFACFNDLALYPDDVLSDRYAPFDDHDARQVANRLVWYGFYRRLANGAVCYAVAVCRQQRNQLFAEQDWRILNFNVTPTALLTSIATDARRLPVPWRVRVGRVPLTNRLYSDPAGPEGLGELAPIGSKIMIQGASYDLDGAPAAFPVPAGRILTVSDVLGNWMIEVVEDVSDLPGDAQGFFDVWIIPPPVVGGNAANVKFGGESPLIDWKVSL